MTRLASDTDAPTLPPIEARRGDGRVSVVPVDVMRIVRLSLLGVYFFVYVWYLRAYGLPLDRITVSISVAIFLLCAFIGRPLYMWAVLGLDIVLYALMWFAYDQTRGAADGLGTPRQLESVRNIDRFLFFGTDPNVWLQKHFWRQSIPWYEKIASTTYFTHFIFPVLAIAILWYASHYQWSRFMKRFATLLMVSCVMFVLLPTIPPWMAAGKDYRAIAPLKHSTGRGFYDLGFRGVVKTWQRALDWGNPVAAMPSLHSAFALLVPAFFLPWVKPKWVKALLMVFPAMMLTSLVYFGEHWVIDGLVGWALVGGSFLLWRWIEQRQRRRRADRARAVLGLASIG